MSFIYRDLECYDRLPPWLRALIRECEHPISAASVWEKLRRLEIRNGQCQVEAAKSIIRSEEQDMIDFLKKIDELREARRKKEAV